MNGSKGRQRGRRPLLDEVDEISKKKEGRILRNKRQYMNWSLGLKETKMACKDERNGKVERTVLV